MFEPLRQLTSLSRRRRAAARYMLPSLPPRLCNIVEASVRSGAQRVTPQTRGTYLALGVLFPRLVVRPNTRLPALRNFLTSVLPVENLSPTCSKKSSFNFSPAAVAAQMYSVTFPVSRLAFRPAAMVRGVGLGAPVASFLAAIFVPRTSPMRVQRKQARGSLPRPAAALGLLRCHGLSAITLHLRRALRDRRRPPAHQIRRSIRCNGRRMSADAGRVSTQQVR